MAAEHHHEHGDITASPEKPQNERPGATSDAPVFPAVPPNQATVRRKAQVEHHVQRPPERLHSYCNRDICCVALTKLLCLYTDQPVGVFGMIQEQAVVPLQAVYSPGQHLSDAIDEARDGTNLYQGKDSIHFQTVLDVVEGEAPGTSNTTANVNKALLIRCDEISALTRLRAHYDPSIMDSGQVGRFLGQLGSLIEHCQRAAPDTRLSSLDAVSVQDLFDVLKWNQTIPEVHSICIHDAISRRASEAPNETAVWAWDGSMSYQELDQVSSRLARHIHSHGLEKKSIIPLCFDKSRWVVVAMLAVLKAGKTFTLIDPAIPPARMAQICRQTKARFAIASERNVYTISHHVSHCLCVDAMLLNSTRDEHHELPSTSPEDVAYVLFTSGSTGEPKGGMITHKGFVSCSSAFGPALGLQKGTRALQFASYAFGASLVEILSTLLQGGCVCLPSEEDRMNDIAGFINKAKLSWALFTPSFIGALSPEQVPGLETLVLGGEPISAEMRDVWASRVTMRYAYGQSETATVCSVTSVKPEVNELNNIGHAAGARFWVTEVGEPNRLSPVGCPGELIVESPGVALGYLKATKEQSASFLTQLPAWYSSIARGNTLPLYRTGDLVRYQPDGTLRYYGRKDSQIKIRGQRIELGEIEAKVRSYLPTRLTPVVEAIEVPHGASNRSLVLLAFLIGKEPVEKGGEVTSGHDAFFLEVQATEELKTSLKDELSAHAIPSYYIRVLTRPLTATGKTDRRELRLIGTRLLEEEEQTRSDLSCPISQGHDPTTAAERTLYQLWHEELRLDTDKIYPNVNFFEYGGDSIAAIKIVNRAKSAGLTLTVRDIFQYPTYRELVLAVRPGTQEHQPIPPLVSSSPGTDTVELSFAQSRMWFLHQLHPDASWYNISLASRLRGPLNEDALTTAVCALQQRHETLRTTFEAGEIGQAIQVVHHSIDHPLAVKYPSVAGSGGYQRLLQLEQETPFDLASKPAWRISLIQLDTDDHILSIVMHHIISDGWSLDLLVQELVDLYHMDSQANQSSEDLIELPALAIQYRDYTVWQKEETQLADHEKQLAYWKKQLKHSNPAELLTDKPRPERLSGRAGFVDLNIDGEQHRKLRSFCQSHQVTPFVVLLAIFRASHYRFTGAEDSTIGTPSANRLRPELEGLIGFFVNNQCMRIKLDDEETLEALVRQVQSTTMAAAENQDVPFERLVSELDPSRDTSKNPLVQLIFALHSQKNLKNIPLPGLHSEPLPTTQPTRFDLECHLFQEDGHLHGYMLFAEDLFEPETIQGLAKVFKDLLRQGLDEPKAPLSKLPLTDGLGDLERLELLDIKRTPYDRDASVVDLFLKQVTTSPDHVAVSDGTSSFTYAELSDASDRVASWLRRRDVKAETIVAVLSPRSCETIIAFLGILKANAAYLPLDVNMPSARLDNILAAAGGSMLVLTGSNVPSPEPKLSYAAEIVPMCTALKADCVGNENRDVFTKPSATSLAYAIFTSGSTGQPKGVLVEHRSVVRLIQAENVLAQIPLQVRMAHVMNLSFDASTWEIYTALLTGGTLVCVDYMTTLDTKALQDVFVAGRVQAATLPPVLLKHCLEQIPLTLAGLDVLHTGGDRLDPHDAARARSLVGRGFFNAYGPAENTVISAIYNVEQDDEFVHGVPIGRAVDNSGAYVMDAYQQLVPLGAFGELVVTGDGLARSYINPELNTERFMDVKINGETVRAYRTGDRVRQRPKDGLLEFFGRIDLQIKLRGFRIEPDDVEHAMLSHDGVRAAAVVKRDGDSVGRDAELVGFVTVETNDQEAKKADMCQVEGWSQHFDTSMQSDIEAIDVSKAGHDFTGWVSMYDGASIPQNEMEEWLQDTINTLLGGESAGRVLEIGTGTGMILLNLGQSLQSYIGLEPSPSAAGFVNKTIKSRNDLIGKAAVRVGTATDVSDLDDFSPDAIVLNSVVQYFPSAAYLEDVVRSLLNIRGVSKIFFGDLRPYTLNRQFLIARAVRSLGSDATKTAVEQKVAELDAREEELLVDPTFFTNFISDDRVVHIEILPKAMRATNELSAYRYAAVIHLRGGRPTPPVHVVSTRDWIDWNEAGLTKEALVALLQTSEQSTVPINNIPAAKTSSERHMLRYLSQDARGDNRETWLSAAEYGARNEASLSTVELHEIARQSGFSVEISWARQASQDGSMDAVFHKHPSKNERSRTLFSFPVEAQSKANGPFINQPGQQQQHLQTSTKLNKHLQRVLPAYMIPAQIVVLNEMPVTSNGKVNRRALAQRAQTVPRSKPTSTRTPARNPTEEALCEEFSEVLGADVGIDDSFFEQGGHSLIATKVVARISRRLDVQISVKDIFDRPRVRDLASMLETGSMSHRPIPSFAYAGPVEQSFAQGRLWFLHQLHQDSSWYSMPLAVRIRGPLHLSALRTALHALEQRHEILRTTFEDRQGIAMQVVHKSCAQKLRVVDVTTEGDYSHLLQQEQQERFDLSARPGWRIVLFQLSDKKSHVLSITMHHIISDGWSVDILAKELSHFYKSAMEDKDPLSRIIPLPIQYRDFAVWQRETEQQAEHGRQLAYWEQQLKDSLPAEIRTDRSRPTRLSGHASSVPLSIQGPLYTRLQEFCRMREVTPFVVLLSAFRIAHFRLTGAEDALVGSPIANRNRPELENMIGFFVNTNCLRIRIDDGDSFEDVVRQAYTTATNAFANQDVPFERIVSTLLPGSRDTSRNPLVQLMFALHSQQNLGKLEFEGLVTERLPVEPATRFDVECHLWQEKNRLGGDLLYSTDLYEPATMRCLVSVFEQVLQQGLQSPDTSVSILPLTSGRESLDRPSLEPSPEQREHNGIGVVDAFLQQVHANLDAIAVKDATSHLTYAQLNEQSDKLAIWLQNKYLPLETLVGVYAPRSCETIVAYLGILKAGLAYLPLDITVPKARTESVITAVPGWRLMLVGSKADLPGLEGLNRSFVRICDALDDDTRVHGEALKARPISSSLAYTIFTSGSTGKPKGVMVEHQSIIRLVKGTQAISNLPRAVRMAHLSNSAFDASVWEIFAPLLTGGSVVCIDHMSTLDHAEVAAIFAEEKIQAALITTALLKEYLANIPDTLANLDVLYTGGDRLDSHDATKARELVGEGFVNAYGPAENGVISTLYPIAAEESDRFIHGVPIGRPILGSGAYVMDACMRSVPAGVIGELVVTGGGLARGYTDTNLDADRFVDIEVDGQTVRGYRTSDRARYRPRDGLLEFFGRMDQQVKIRGNRIEPAEVEKAMLDSGTVEDAAVIVRKPHDSGAELVGFMTAKDEGLRQDAVKDQVDGWKDHFELNTYANIDSMDQANIGRDFTGWTSMIDGKDIPQGEMSAWLDDTIHAIHNGREAGNVLEIGTGSGMVLFNLDGVMSYIGLEPSPSMTAFVNKTADSMPSLAGRTKVHVGSATNLSRLGTIGPDLVIINSVAQYFPSGEYLMDLIKTLVRISGVKRLHFGDMRPHTLNQQLLVARALHSLGDGATKGALSREMIQTESREEELLVDPVFFTNLADSMSKEVAHVEILPKLMRATNELSGYRYAAVVHLHNADLPTSVQSIDAKGWIDFEKSELTRQALLDLVKQRENGELLAIGNVPHSKTILERHLVESLGVREDHEVHDWVSGIRAKSGFYPALSAFDLVEIAREAGSQVQISWARQQSHHGALDAVFYHASPDEHGRRLFDFPKDNVRRTTALTNRPMQRQQHRRLETEMRAMLKNTLPAYMIPAKLVALDHMPVNANGKVDRQSLYKLIPEAKEEKLTSTLEFVAPRNEMEAALCEEFSAVLGVQIGVTDNAFDRGLHSLLVSKVAAMTTRRLNRRVTVRDVFDKPVVEELAGFLQSQSNSSSTEQDGPSQEPRPFEELPGNEVQFVQQHIAPQLQHQTGKILDAYPATRMQKNHLFNPLTTEPRMPPQFMLDLPLKPNVDKLREALEAITQHFDIFRSVFVWAADELYQVVLDHVKVPIKVVNKAEAGKSIHIPPEPVQFGQPLLRFTIFEDHTDTIRLGMQISHAIYDGVSLGHIVHSLHSLLDGQSLSLAPQFAHYRRHILGSRQNGHDFWRSVLSGAAMTNLRDAPSIGIGAKRPAMVWTASKTIEAPVSSGGVTTATIFTAASALMLATQTGSKDVLFGRVVSGRQCLPEAHQSIVGPCFNIVPVRLNVEEVGSGPRQLLKKLQSQYIQSLPFETLGWDELRENCTDLPADVSNYGCCVTYQNLEMPQGLRIESPFASFDASREKTSLEERGGDDAPSQLEDLGQSPIHDIEIGGGVSADGLSLRVTIEVSERLCNQAAVDDMLQRLCENISQLARSLK